MPPIQKLTPEEIRAFADNVSALRRARPIDDLARKAQISSDAWYKIERGERIPSLSTARSIARALGVKLSTLVKPID